MPFSPSALPSGTTGEGKMDHNNYPDPYLRDILTSVRTIASISSLHSAKMR